MHRYYPMKEYNKINYTYTELLKLDTKNGILYSFKALDIKVSKSLKKAELAEMMATVFEENPFYIINRLSKEDQNLLKQLVACNQDEYVLVSKRPEPLGLQLHHLVVTVPDGDNCKLYMPDSIRKHIDKSAMMDMSIYPGMEEWNKTMEELTKLQQQIEYDVKFNPTVLPIQELPMYIQRLRHELSNLDKLTKELKSHESQIKQYNIDFNPIYAGIEVSRTQCETKITLMEMFKWG